MQRNELVTDRKNKTTLEYQKHGERKKDKQRDTKRQKFKWNE